MATGLAMAGMLTDGDAAFVRVDNRRPAHALEPGVAAGAINCRFDNGKPRPRHGVALEAWGTPGLGADMVGGGNFDFPEASGYSYVNITGFVVGNNYLFTIGAAYKLTTSGAVVGGYFTPSGTEITPGVFTATQDNYWLWAFDTPPFNSTSKDSTFIKPIASGNTCAYKRFNDVGTNTDNCVLITDEYRTSGDGGKGRAWRIRPGNAPEEISLNGHDVWEDSQLIQCHNAMVLLRPGNERHYFVTADVNSGADTITLHCTPSWATGAANAARVRFVQLETAAILGSTVPPSLSPASGNYYYAKRTGAVTIELYSDSGCTNKMVWDSVEANGRWYLELAVTPTPWFGNIAPPLIMQGTLNTLAMDVGFVAVTDDHNVTTTVAASDIITAENHRLQPGDNVNVSLSTDTFTNKFAAPQSEHTFRLYSTVNEALIDSGTALSNVTVDSQTGTVTKVGAAGIAMPGGRAGVYYKGRFILVNGNDNLLISDPYDFLHFTLFTGQVAASFGESGKVVWMVPLGEDTLLVGKELSIFAISGLSGASDGWRMEEVTREYGGIAPLAALNVGTDVWLMSRKGVASVVRTVAGERLGVARTVSHAIPEYLMDLDWSRANHSCAEVWNNRFFLGVPTKNQTTPVNNRVLVHNFLNQLLRVNQGTDSGDVVGGVTEVDAVYTDSWEGAWEGALLTPYAFAKLSIAGEERLTFATADGTVCWLHDGWDDVGAEIETELLTRGYFGGREMIVTGGAMTAETFRPVFSVTAKTAGYKEETAIITDRTPSATTYQVYGQADYDPAASTTTTFELPHREDYSPTADELFTAELDVHQTVTESLPMRQRDRVVQLRISNRQGSLRVVSTSVTGMPVGMAASRST